MKFIDLFSGIGGFRLGLERAGHECVGSCEIDRYAREIYAKHFVGNIRHDVRHVHANEVPNVDIITAGFPCQSFSIAGQRLGFDDTRGTLFFEIARLAKEIRPKILFLENVKGLLNHDKGRTFGTIINTLYELGYDVEWQVINGKYFVPQNRERVFIIGHSRSKPSTKIFPITDIYQKHDKALLQAQSEGEWIRGPSTRTIDSNYWKGGGSRTMICVFDSGFASRHRIYDKKGIMPTMMTPSGGHFEPKIYDNAKIRKLTPLECERLMGFPDNWTEGVSDHQRYKMLGNSVIPQIIEMIGRQFD